MAITDREIGQILEALKQGEQQRGEFRQSISEAKDEITALREVISGMRADFMTTAKRAEDAAVMANRVGLLEARLGNVVNDVQSMQSFISLAKSYSVRTAFIVLCALAFGGVAISKAIEWIFHFPILSK